jgi:biopolymer transport protein ExbB
MLELPIIHTSLAGLAQIVGPETVQIDWFAQLQQGGIVVIVQGFLVVALIAISIERFLALKINRFAPPGFVDDVLQSGSEDTDSLYRRVSGTTHTMGRVVTLILEQGLAQPALRDDVKDLALRDVDAEYEKLASLTLIAAAAPLLGLLGTMIGMIESFQLVALYGDEGGASMLADSIAKALITTAVGLIIALPALFLHHLLKRRLQKLTRRLENDLERIHRHWLGSSPSPSE